jgi:uncharacterized protein (DUF1810 family)
MTSTAPDPFNLARFLEAQEGSSAAAIEELRAGQKRSHWMWYVFPQVAGLGSSAMARRYAIRSCEEARAYLAHPLLGRRLEECAQALLRVEGRSAEQVMGFPDCLKLCSSMTLFAEVSPPGSVFARVLEKYYAGERDQRTVDSLPAK